MPYIYAIEEHLYDKVPSDFSNYNEYDEYTRWHSTQTFITPAEQWEAEAHEGGVWALTDTQGNVLSGWVNYRFKTPDGPISATLQKNRGRGIPLTDIYNETLQAGDYVFTIIRKNKIIQICEVISFTKDKIRILPVENIEQAHGMLKFPHEIVKVPSSKFEYED